MHNSHNFVNYNWCRCGHLNLSIKDLKKSNCLNSSPRLWASFPVFATRAGTCSHWRNPWTSAVKWFTAFSRCYAILTGNNDNEHWTCSFCISLVGKATVFLNWCFVLFAQSLEHKILLTIKPGFNKSSLCWFSFFCDIYCNKFSSTVSFIKHVFSNEDIYWLVHSTGFSKYC